MKNISKYSLMAFLVTAMVFVACTKEEDDLRLDPKLTTISVSNIGSDSATISGFVIAEGEGFNEKGVCYDLTENPTVESNKVAHVDTADNALFSVILRDLDYATKYYARAYALNGSEAIYGDTVSFITKPVVPSLTTAEISDISGNSASGGGNVTGTGGADVTAYGVCFSTEQNPTLNDSKTEDGSGTGEFISSLEGLKGNTMYYVRAYATNDAGTGYGPEVSFTTLVDLPEVTTAAISNITKVSAVSGGEVIYDGGGAISERGIVWSLNADPTTTDNKVMDGSSDVGVFVSDITGLNENTTYHARAYAINSAGTSYGDNVSFTTLADITKFWIVGDYNGWDNSDNADFIISTPTSNGAAEGYVFLTSGGIKLTTDHSWDDAHTFGDDGSGGLTNPGNNIDVAADGYYLIKASLVDMTYSLTKTIWGVIGDATPNGWDSETPLTFYAVSGTWQGGVHFTTGEFKFRANQNWDYNYGSNAGDETLDPGGNNIPVSVEADYAIELNLSVPNEYTYSAHRWGIIGNATPGGWDSDTDMTWNEVDGVLSVSVDLIVGEFKFRADDDWAINLGGDIGALTQDGANLNVAEGGNYTITLNPWDKGGTITKN
ncbi:MAG: SusF/SusE family outer membrane protein [Bacteroidales bacterium]